MLNYFAKVLVNTPFYPFWLEHIKLNSGNEKILQGIAGEVLEVGAGDASRKKRLLQKYQNIKTYVATDYCSWDDEFEKLDIKANNKAKEIFLGYKPRPKLDKVCSATNLPFDSNTFDYHLSFEVLEHIDCPEQFFSEATRVVRKGGYILVCVPFLFRMHGGEPQHKMDYFRYLNGFFYKVAADNNLDVIEIYSNTGYGTTFASLTNQFLIRKIVESNWIVKIILFFISPLIFLLSNMFGLIIDISPDLRFATRLHIRLKKA